MSEERLQRIEEILLTTVSLTQQNREDIARLTGEMRSMTANIERTSDLMNQFIIEVESDREFFQFARNELIAIRTDVSRIVDYLFGQQEEP